MTMASTYVDHIEWNDTPDEVFERVEKLPVPLLVIGLGGTGISALKTIRRKFAQSFRLSDTMKPACTAYLGIDIDRTSRDDLSFDEFVDIFCPDLVASLYHTVAAAVLPDDELAWVHHSLSTLGQGIIGSGGNRQLVRLMLSRQYHAVAHAITAALSGITSQCRCLPPRLEIVIVSGVCGGTGSGIFLDIPQIIRHCLLNNPDLADFIRNFQITGYIVMPDVSLHMTMDPVQRRHMEAVGYAALKELDFWMNVGEHRTPYTMTYHNGPAISWTQRPYDQCILIGRSCNPMNGHSDARIVYESIAEHLLHVMADEEPCENRYIGDYSYIDHESNVQQYCNFMHRPLPVGYHYRAISVRIKRLPWRKMLYCQGRLLFSTFMPMRDEHGELVPNPRLIQVCESREHAAYIVGDAEKLYMDFCRIATLKDFCSVSPDDTPKLDAMRQWPIRPHDQYDHGTNPWLSSIVTPQANRAAEEYLKQAWKRFLQFAEQIINDPKQGPFSLRMYLTAENNGLRSALSAYIKFWDNRASQFASERGSLFQSCRDSWHDFEKPPFFGGKKAVEAYMTHLNRFYNGLRKHAFMVAYAKAANQLLKRVDEFIEDALRPLCRDLDELQKRFDAPQLLTMQDDEDLVFVQHLVPYITDVFLKENADNRITLAFLNDLFTSVLASRVPDDLPDGMASPRESGHSDDALRKQIMSVMRSILNNYCADVNLMTLDDLVMKLAPPGTAPNAVCAQFIQDCLQDTGPLLIRDNAAPRVVSRYFSVPSDSPLLIQQCSLAREHSDHLKRSALRDHICCITTEYCLPMHSILPLREQAMIYQECLLGNHWTERFHLVWDGNPGSDYTRNWYRLPSPCPHYFLGLTPGLLAENDWLAVQELTARSVACGQIVLDTDTPMPSFTVRTYWADPFHHDILPCDVIRQRVQALETGSPADAPMSPAERRAGLRAYLGEADSKRYSPGYSPSCMAKDQGLAAAYIDPFDMVCSIDAEIKAVARENYSRLCQALTAAMIAANPRLRLIIARQVEGFEALHEALGRLENVRSAYVGTFADCMMFDLIRIGADGSHYLDEAGEAVPLIAGDRLADDLKDEASPLVKALAYLADLSEADPVRRHLDAAAARRRQEMDGQEATDTLSAEAVKAILERLTGLLAMADDQRKLECDALSRPGADQARIRSRIALLDACQCIFTSQRAGCLLALQTMG
ncbi:MAG: tubulin-like doman-containing protein [Aristaeellaceae bacterium]